LLSVAAFCGKRLDIYRVMGIDHWRKDLNNKEMSKVKIA
jgi:hypothetical protein